MAPASPNGTLMPETAPAIVRKVTISLTAKSDAALLALIDREGGNVTDAANRALILRERLLDRTDACDLLLRDRATGEIEKVDF